MTELTGYLDNFERRIRLRSGWLLWQRTGWLACLCGLILQILGRFVPIIKLTALTFAPLVLWLFTIVGISILRQITRIEIAKLVDLELGLKERLSSALYLASKSHAFPDNLVSAQYSDALKQAGYINPSKAFPLTWQRRQLIFAGALALTVAVLLVMPNPMTSVLAERAAISEAANAQAERIEELSASIDAAETLSPEERLDLQRKLAELAQQLRENPGDAEQAMADLAKMEEAAKALLDPQAAAKNTNLSSLASQLENITGTKPTADLEASESIAAALEQLVEQISEMNDAQQQGIAESLATLAAQTAQAGDQELAQAIANLAQAMQSGDQQAIQQAAQNASQAAANTESQLQTQSLLQQTLAQLQASQQAIAQAAAKAGAQSAANASSSPGGQQGQPGQSQSGAQGANAGSSGGGTSANTLPPSTRAGTAGRPQGSTSGTIGGDLDKQLYIPRLQGQSNGNELSITGIETGQGETQASQGTNPSAGTNNPVLVPFYEVYYQYLAAMNQSLENSYIPISLQEYIRLYFLQLGIGIEETTQ